MHRVIETPSDLFRRRLRGRCEWCQTQYEAKRTHSRTCSARCRKALSREIARLNAGGMSYYPLHGQRHLPEATNV